MGAETGQDFLTRPARVLRGMLFALAGGHGVALAAGVALGWTEAIPFSFTALALALCGVALMGRGRVTAGFGLGAYGTVLVVLYSAYQANGVQNIGIAALPTVIVLSGLLLDRRFLILATGVSIIGVWAMVGARWVWLERTPDPDMVGNLLILSVIMGLASMAGWVFSAEVERKARALWESEQRYRKVVDCVPDTIWMTDLDGRFTYVTQAAERTHGWKPEELRGKSYQEIMPASEVERRRLLILEEVKRAQQPGYDHSRALRFESVEWRKDGTTFDVDVTLSLLWSDEGRLVGFIGATRDITERKRLQGELAQAQKLESIGRLAGGVAHDFNNHLTVINGYTRLAMGKLGEGVVRGQLEEVAKAGERAASLTRQLLAFSRRQMLAPRRLDVNRVVAEMAPMLERLMTGDVGLRVELGNGPAVVLADRHQLEQVVMNLAVNARDAMPRGGTLTIETERLAEQRVVRLRVTDNGQGMTAETRARIFEPFFTTKETGRGTGLGLAMVQGIVAQSGGRIEVESEEGRGTKFDVLLPWVEGEEERDGTQAEAVDRGRETVLVVEDQGEVREYVAEALAESGYRVLKADGAEEALRLAGNAGVDMDLVITDVLMPGMEGGELARRLWEVRPALKVLFMSGYAEREKLGQVGRGSFLPKPFTPEQLGTKVRAILEAAEG